MRRIQAKKHKIGTYETDKISLSCFDDKRFILDDEIHTLAYFRKDSVKSCKKIQKGCDKKKRLKEIVIKKEGLKKIVIIEKHCDKKEGIKKNSHIRERFSQMIINKRFKRFS